MHRELVALLTRAQIDAVQSLVNAYGHGATQRELEARWDQLAAPAACELLEHQLTERNPSSFEYMVVDARLKAVVRSIREGVQVAFAGYDAAAEAIVAVLNAPDWDAVQAALAGRLHDLLPDIADVAFADRAMQPSSDEEHSQVLGGWNLIRACRREGVAAAVEAQRRGHRGFTVDAETARMVAAARTADDLAAIETDDRDLALRMGRRAEYDGQVAAWAGRDAYMEAYGAADAGGRIELARQALAGVDREALPLVWMLIARDLARDLREAAGEDAPDLQEPIALWRAVLQILHPKADPDDYGKIQHRLGVAYLADTGGDAEENTEHAVAAFEAALSVLRPRVETVEWARGATNLAEALRRRATLDRAADLDRAAQLAREAVELLKGEQEPRLLALARYNLGTVLLERVTGDENWRDAEDQFRAVLQDWEPEIGATVAARAHFSLGSLAWKQARLDPARYEELLNLAGERFRAALDQAEAAGLDRERALAHEGLGLVASDRVGAADYGAAIDHLETAIELLEATGAPPGELGALHHTLGVVHGECPDAETDEHVAAANQHFVAALELFDSATHPADRRDTLRAFGSLHFTAGQWREAHGCYEEATKLAEDLLGGIVSESGRRAEAAGDRDLFSRDAYCLLRLGRPGEALARLDHGMARRLTESLRLQAGVAKGGGDAARWAADEIKRLRDETRSPGVGADPQRSAGIGRRLRDAYRHLGDAIGPTQRRDLGELLAAIPTRGAVIAPVVTTQGSAAIVVPAGTAAVTADHVVDLPRLDMAAIGAIVAGDAGELGWVNALLAHERGDITADDLDDALGEAMSRVGASFAEPVLAKLDGLSIGRDATVVVVPQGWLSLLPVHAAAADDGEALIDRYEVWFTPSLAVLASCADRLAGGAGDGAAMLAVANPTLDLDFAEPEVNAVAALFREHRPGGDLLVLRGSAASREAVLGSLPGRQYTHFACHGAFDWAEPDASRLVLAAGDELSLGDILSPDADLDGARLVVLSACETGLTEFRAMPDEFLGLAGALLEGGAACVISSLWSIDDLSTKLLMADFYRRHLGGASVGTALRCAQRWLRAATAAELGLAEEFRAIYARNADPQALEDAEFYAEHGDNIPFAGPFYWAAFTATGAAR